MAHVFLSYATPDRNRAKDVADALELRGWTVWWDRKIPLGRSFDEVIEEAIAEAKCLVVLWSAASVASEWVRSEASEGKRRGILVPVFLEPVKAPLAFRLLNGADLSTWQSGTHHPEFDRLADRITEIIAQPGERPKERARPADGVAPDRPARKPWFRNPLVIGAVGVLLLIAGVNIRYVIEKQLESSTSRPFQTGGEGAGNKEPQPFDPSDIVPTGGQVALKAFHATELGIDIAFVPREGTDSLGIAGLSSGAIVWKIESGPAQAADLHAGDVIMAIGGNKIATEDDLRRALKKLGPGTTRFLIRRGSQDLTVDINCPGCTSS